MISNLKGVFLMINNLKRSAVGLIFSLSAILSISAGKSARAMQCTVQNYDTPEKFISVNLKFDSKAEFLKNFEEDHALQVEYNKKLLSFKDCSFEGNVSNKPLKLGRCKQFLTIDLDSSKDILETNEAPNLKLVFKVKKDAASCETSVNVNRIKKEKLNSYNIHIDGNPEIDKCRLENLVPSAGKLSPPFNPNVFDYELTVDSEVKDLDFNSSPMRQGLITKVNRKRLSAPGKETNIKISVSDPDLKIKKSYNVKVHRKEKPSKVKVVKCSNRAPVTTSEPFKENQNNIDECDDGCLNDSNISDNSYNSDDLNDTVAFDDSNKYEPNLEKTKNFLTQLKHMNVPSHHKEPLTTVKIPKEENNNLKVYVVIGLLLVTCTALGYLIYKRIKLNQKNTDNSLNK